MASDESFSGFIRPEAAPMRDGGRFADITEVSERGVCRVMRGRRHGRWWALKCLREEYAGDEVYRALLRKEFEMGIALQHPGIVNVAGLEDVPVLGLTLVMEWVDGADLDDWLKTHQSRSRRRKVFGQILDAVEYAHTHQTVHRDLKPSNILVTRSGEYVKLIDFGLSDTDSHAEFKQGAGTEGFVSPEQRAGGATDVRNDIYSLGRILRLMKLGAGSAGVARKCLAAIDRRYSSVEDLRRALVRRRTATLWGAAILVLATLGAGVWMVLPGASSGGAGGSGHSAAGYSAQEQPDELVSGEVDQGALHVDDDSRGDGGVTREEAEAAAPASAETAKPAIPDEAAINAIIDRGRVAADRRLALYDIPARLDTATTRGSLFTDIDNARADMRFYVMRFVAGEAPGAGEQMRDHIEQSIMDHLDRGYFAPWQEAAGRLPKE